MKIAEYIKDIEGFNGVASLYRLSEPLGYRGHIECEYVIVFAIIAFFTGTKTYIFGANKEGEVVSWVELPGSTRGTLDHATALANAGYQIGIIPNRLEAPVEENEDCVGYEFSGYLVLSKGTLLQYCGEDENMPALITVGDWLLLDEEIQSEYILEDFIAAYRDAEDVSHEDHGFFIDDD